MSAALRRKLKGKKPPEGWELIEEVMEDFEQQMKVCWGCIWKLNAQQL